MVTMADGLDWLMRPVLRGKCSYESLINGQLSLYDVALMNEAMNVDDENRYRMQAASNKGT